MVWSFLLLYILLILRTAYTVLNITDGLLLFICPSVFLLLQLCWLYFLLFLDYFIIYNKQLLSFSGNYNGCKTVKIINALFVFWKIKFQNSRWASQNSDYTIIFLSLFPKRCTLKTSQYMRFDQLSYLTVVCLKYSTYNLASTHYLPLSFSFHLIHTKEICENIFIVLDHFKKPLQ